jgi:hypothetical protein
MPFSSPAWVVLPDHIHCIWKLPSDDDDYALRWSLLKRHFMRAQGKHSIVPKGNRKGERRLWQRRFWEHAIRDERDLENHFTYIRRLAPFEFLQARCVTRLSPPLRPWFSKASMGKDGAFQARNAPYRAKRITINTRKEVEKCA